MPLRGNRIGPATVRLQCSRKGISYRQLSYARLVTSGVFDDLNLVSAAGLVPLVKLARRAGLSKLAAEHLTVPTDKGANAG